MTVPAFGWLARRFRRDNAAARCGDVLAISVSELGWRATIAGTDGEPPVESEGHADPELQPDVVAVLRRAVRGITPSQRERIERVRVLTDDPVIRLVDNRSLRMRSDDPVAVRQAGAQELGCNGATYAVQQFGASSEHEMPRAVYAFLSTERMQDYFGALDSLAVKLVELVPSGLLRLARADDTPFALLAMRGTAATLLLADPRTSAAFCRELPVGVATLARTVAEATSISMAEAAAGLERRICFPANPAADGTAPATATERALAPVLASLRDELLAAQEYFVFQRLANAPERLEVTGVAERVRGLVPWLEAVMELPATPAAELHGRFSAGPAVDACNLLATIPKGLLRIGKTEYRFEGGRFAADHVVRSGAGPSRGQAPGGAGRLLAAMRGAASVRISWGPVAGGAGVAAALAALLWLTVQSSAGTLDRAAGALAAALNEDAIIRTALARRTRPAGQEARPVMPWTDRLQAIARAIPDGVQLVRLTTATEAPAGRERLVLEGEAPRSGDYLRAINEFISRLSADPAFARDVASISFDGASTSSAADRDIRFAVTAVLKPGAAATP